MKPRWIDDDRTVNDERLGYTVIAKWRPWIYYRIITFRVDGASALQRMTSSLELNLPLDAVPAQSDYFVTVVVQCNRFGVPRTRARHLLERKYSTFDEALSGHESVVVEFGGEPTL